MGKNTLYEPAWKMYESPNAGEPVAEDGYVPRNRNARPGLLGIMPDITDRNYTILNDPVLIKQKQALKAALKEEYLKQAYNPYRHAAGAGGMPFDSSAHRYITLMRTQIQFFRPTVRTTFLGLSLYFFPVVILYWHVSKVKAKDEAIYRSGAIAYKDRHDKYMN